MTTPDDRGPRRYRKKPVVIEAMHLTDDTDIDVVTWLEDNGVDFLAVAVYGAEDCLSGIDLPTMEGTMRADIGDWIIKGVQGEFYPCKPDIFDATYEEVFDDDD